MAAAKGNPQAEQVATTGNVPGPNVTAGERVEKQGPSQPGEGQNPPAGDVTKLGKDDRAGQGNRDRMRDYVAVESQGPDWSEEYQKVIDNVSTAVEKLCRAGLGGADAGEIATKILLEGSRSIHR